MAVLILGEPQQAMIDVAVDKARKSPVPLAVVTAGAMERESSVMTLKDRKPGFERPPSAHVQLGQYLAAISFETQPCGLCRHLSVSVEDKEALPSPTAVEMIAAAFGFPVFPPTTGKIWLEEFEPGHLAVNVLQVEPT